MTRGMLPDRELTQIEKELIPVIPLRERALAMAPDLISASFPATSEVPVAAVCFQDATRVLCECRTALYECYTHGIYYRQYKSPPQESTATSMEQFFLSDLALRLYPAGEHLASAIIFALEITEADLARYKNGRASIQLVVGNYLINEQPKSLVTQAIRKLAASREWKLAMKYRGEYVHDQPPSVEGLGIWYKRQPRWTRDPSAKKMTLALGSGDKPDYSTERVREFLEKGFSCLVQAAGECIGCFERELRSKNVQLQ